MMRARVAASHGALVDVLCEDGTAALLPLAGRLRLDGALPVVGDWVRIEGGAVCALEPRRSVLMRQAAGARVAEQAIAANLDLAVLVTAPGDLSLRRLERYL